MIQQNTQPTNSNADLQNRNADLQSMIQTLDAAGLQAQIDRNKAKQDALQSQAAASRDLSSTLGKLGQ